jgi:MerR family transcriptional regulator, light-induced transcriptional regulator
MVTESTDSTTPRHPIRVVARRTGLTPEVIRVWEKRYGVVAPQRTEGGRRRYTDADVERLRLLDQATAGGRRISQVAGLSTVELRAMVEEDRATEASARAAPPPRGPAAGAEGILADSLKAVESRDAGRLGAVLSRGLVSLTPPVFLDDVVVPLMGTIGELWHAGRLDPAHEHLASSVVRSVLEGMTRAVQGEDPAPLLVAGTPAGQRHEIGAMIAAATAAAEGWQVTYLSPDLPARDIAAVAEEGGARAVALSLVYPGDDGDLPDQLRLLRTALPRDTALIVGGAAVESYRPVLDEVGAMVLADTDALRGVLAELAGGL